MQEGLIFTIIGGFRVKEVIMCPFEYVWVLWNTCFLEVCIVERELCVKIASEAFVEGVDVEVAQGWMVVRMRYAIYL